MYEQEAKDAGVNTKGKIYLGGLARYPGDPEAWVSGRGDVQRICETRGWGSRGAVNVKSQEPTESPVETPLAEDIVTDKVTDIMSHVPKKERKRVDVTELREQVKDKMTPPWSKK